MGMLEFTDMVEKHTRALMNDRKLRNRYYDKVDDIRERRNREIRERIEAFERKQLMKTLHPDLVNMDRNPNMRKMKKLIRR